MDAEKFRPLRLSGLVDWVADYREGLARAAPLAHGAVT